MKYALRTLLVALLVVFAAPAWAGEVKLQIANGMVTLQARDATIREILTEWARIGQVQVVNAEKIAATPVTIDLQGVPEGQALNTLLRSVSGYIASPRQALAGPAQSAYDRIVVMAAPRPAVNASSYTPPPTTPQSYGYRGQPGMMGNPPMVDDQDQPIGPPPNYPGMAQPGRGVLPPQPPQQQGPTPGQLPQGAPGTVSPMPGQPGGTGAPGTVAQPKRPGGPGGGEGGGGEGGRP